MSPTESEDPLNALTAFLTDAATRRLHRAPSLRLTHARLGDQLRDLGRDPVNTRDFAELVALLGDDARDLLDLVTEALSHPSLRPRFQAQLEGCDAYSVVSRVLVDAARGQAASSLEVVARSPARARALAEDLKMRLSRPAQDEVLAPAPGGRLVLDPSIPPTSGGEDLSR